MKKLDWANLSIWGFLGLAVVGVSGQVFDPQTLDFSENVMGDAIPVPLGYVIVMLFSGAGELVRQARGAPPAADVAKKMAASVQRGPMNRKEVTAILDAKASDAATFKQDQGKQRPGTPTS